MRCLSVFCIAAALAVVLPLLVAVPILCEDKVEEGARGADYSTCQPEVLDPDFRHKGSPAKRNLCTKQRFTHLIEDDRPIAFPAWRSDLDLGLASGVSMDVVPAGSSTGRILLARMKLTSGSDTIFTYYSTDGGGSWNEWWKIIAADDTDFNDFCIAAGRTTATVFYQLYTSSKDYLSAYIFDFSGGYTHVSIDSTDAPVTEMHPDAISDAEDYSSVWYYLVYSTGEYSGGIDLRFIILDESGGLHSDAFLDGAGSFKTYWDGDIDFDAGNVFATWHVLDDSLIRARFTSDLGSSWTGKMNVSVGADDSKPRIAGHDNHAVVVMEDSNGGPMYNFTIDFGSSWTGPWDPGLCDATDGCPALTECDAHDIYHVYFSKGKQRAHATLMECTMDPWKGDSTVGGAQAQVREYAHCYEIRHLWNSGLPKSGVVWIDNRLGPEHAWYDQGVVGITEADLAGIPQYASGLYEIKPNPFCRQTAISYALEEGTHTSLGIYDVSGRLVQKLVNETQPAGLHSVTWSAEGNPSGTYFCMMQAGGFSDMLRMVLLK